MKRFLFLFVSLFALAAPTVASAAPVFGAEVNSGFVSQERGQQTAAATATNLSALYRAGGRVGRTETVWQDTEPKAPVHGHHTYNWSYNDLIASEMAAARLQWEPTLAFAPRWAEKHESNVLHLKGRGKVIAFLPPASNANFAAYATAFLKRYGRHGSFWKSHRSLPYEPVTTVEIWNEPDNLYDWGAHINLSDYARMYETVRTALRRVDRHVKAMTGGLAFTQSSLPRMLKAFRGKPIDILAVHPYGATPARTIQLTKITLADMRHFGRGRTPVAANEYGWTSDKGTYGSTNPRNVKKYVYAALIGLAKLHLLEIEPYMWSQPSWGLSTGAFASAVSKITHHHYR